MADVTCAGLLSFAVLYCISASGDEHILNLNLIQWYIPASVSTLQVGVCVVCIITVLFLSYWSVMYVSYEKELG